MALRHFSIQLGHDQGQDHSNKCRDDGHNQDDGQDFHFRYCLSFFSLLAVGGQFVRQFFVDPSHQETIGGFIEVVGDYDVADLARRIGFDADK